jgi:hypothetical protein
MHAFRQRFLNEGLERLQQFMADLEGLFPADEAARSAHQWVGTGGLLGYSDISRLAREVAVVLAERPLDNAQLRESLSNLALAFGNPPPLPPHIKTQTGIDDRLHHGKEADSGALNVATPPTEP